MHKSRAYLYLHISVFLFGFTAILGKLISLDHFGLVWNRMWIALPLFLVIPGFISHLKAFSFKKAMLFLSIGILVAAHWITFYGSIKIGNSASLTLASLGLASWFTSIIEPIVQKTKINKVDMGFGLLAVLGITLIAFSQDELDPNATQSQFLLAIIWGIISALLATLFSVFNAKYAKKESPLLITFFEMLGGFLFLSIIYLLIKDQAEMQHYLQINNVQLNVPNIDWKWLLLLGVLCTTGAFVLNVAAMRVVSAFTANVAINLEPVYGIILAFFIFNEGESFNYLFYVGTLIILSTVFAQSYYSFIKKKINGHQSNHQGA
ncbi:DMT family transporter [Bacteroidia bacterium]|nr:DMT family transporter [Bacteroidia bacterium]